jgi:RNA polymerase sigma-70 factor (ECF subfamily)
MDEFEALLASSRTAVERWVKARVSGRADAEDILQDTYMAAFQGFSSLRSREAFLPWILGIARRKYADWYRARAKSPLVFTDTLPERAEEAPEDTAVEETLEKLSQKDRLMLLLFYREMLSQKQISLRLGIPEGTVKSRLHNARSKLKERLQKYAE